MSHVPVIVVFTCHWGGEVAATSTGAHVVPMPVLCAGSVHPNTILEALNNGADGVLLAPCSTGGCHYAEGDRLAAQRAEAARLLFEDFGFEPERFRFEALNGEPGQLSRALAEMAAELAALGPSPYA